MGRLCSVGKWSFGFFEKFDHESRGLQFKREADTNKEKLRAIKVIERLVLVEDEKSKRPWKDIDEKKSDRKREIGKRE